MIPRFTTIASCKSHQSAKEFLSYIEKICKEFKSNRIRHAILYFSPEFTAAMQNFSPYIQTDEESKFLGCLKMKFRPSQFQKTVTNFTLYIDTYEFLPHCKEFSIADKIEFAIDKDRQNVFKLNLKYEIRGQSKVVTVGTEPIGSGNLSDSTISKPDGGEFAIHPTYGMLNLKNRTESTWYCENLIKELKRSSGKFNYMGVEVSACRIPKQMTAAKNKNKLMKVRIYDVANILNSKYTVISLVNGDMSLPEETIESSFLHLVNA